MSKKAKSKIISINNDNKVKNNKIFLQVSSLIITVTLIYIITFKTSIYSFVFYQTVIKSNRNVFTGLNVTQYQKYELKCGFDYKFVESINKLVPDTSIILMPGEETIFPKGIKPIFNKKNASGIKNKAWATYFVYPRKLVYADEAETNPYYDKIDHIAIINGIGYEKLNYVISNRSKIKHTVLPVDPALIMDKESE